MNPNSFAKIIGVTSSTLSSMFKKKHTNPGYDTVIKILKAFPSSDERWLLTGLGEMIKNPQ
ncbi:helix-turn-helix domain-containing protein [Flavobacterium sp. LAR06]|uniref:helix-turn-helix domain-containing protein n=1 Tax=Flavobacterium sp. LAR06 TaxID=3064897 RepID=UPI0035BFF3B1